MSDSTRPSVRRQDLAQRLIFVRALIDARESSPEIERQIADKFNLSSRAAVRLIELACQEIRREADKSIEDHRCDAYSFYLSVIRDPKNSTRDRLRAQERIDKLFGLEAPLKISATDQAGNDVIPPTINQAEIRIQVTEALAKALSHATIST